MVRRPILFSALLALAVFAVTLGGTFVYDDVAVVATDKRLDAPIAWRALWTESYNAGVDNLYRPLVSTTYALQRVLHGTTAWPFHLVNWLLHAGVSALVAWVALRLATGAGADERRARFASLVAGVLFAVHPIHVEAVANVVGRAELMCAAGTLGAIGLCLAPLTRARVAGAFACLLVAILSKEQGLLAPLLVGLCMFAIRTPTDGHPRASPEQRSRAATLFALFAVGVAAMVVLREDVLHLKFWWDRSFLDPWIQPLVDVGPRDRALGAAAIAGRYLQLLVAPAALRIDYGGSIVPGVTRLADPYLWLGVVAIATWLALAEFAFRRRDRALGATLLSFAIVYGMIGNVVTLIGVNVAERVMYLPSAFFVIAIALLAARLPRRTMVVGTSIVATLFAARSATYAWQWNDALRLYEYSVRVEPRSMKATLLAMQARTDRGDLDDAERLGLHAIAIDPTYSDAYCRLATVSMMRGDLDAAERSLDVAFRLSPAGRAGGLFEALKTRRASTRPATSPAP